MDLRIGPRPFGPFDSHQDFHAYIRENLAIENCTRTFGQQVTECHARKYRSCFTHADLCLRNILVHNGKVAAIVDWGFGGWYPEYWEYTKAHYGQMDLPEWYEGLESALDRYDHELEAEQILWDQCDEPGLLWERERLPEPGLGADNPNTLGH